MLKLTEAAPGSGSVCGSTFINRIFQKWLEDVLKDDPNWDDQVRESATRDFENDVKKRFKGTWEDTYFVSGEKASWQDIIPGLLINGSS